MAKDNEYMRNYMRAYAAKRRQAAIDLLGGKCSVCGSTETLEIHHCDPAQKSFTVSSRMTRAWSVILEELKKCELLCDPCHGKFHASKALHGTMQRYKRGCRCETCIRANSEYNRAYRLERTGKEVLPKKVADHGSVSMYNYHRCRCDVCKDGNRIRQKQYQDNKRSNASSGS